MGQGRGARLDLPVAAAADQGGAGRRVVRCAERGAGDQWLSGGKSAGDRVDRGDLQGGFVVEVGEQRREAFGEHRLATAGWAGEADVVTAGGADLEYLPRFGLPAYVSQVELAAPGTGAGGEPVGGSRERFFAGLRLVGIGRRWQVAESGQEGSQRPDSDDSHAGNQ